MIVQDEYIIRDASIEDLPAIVEIYNSTIAGKMVAGDIEAVTIEDKEKWFKEHTPNARPVWVMEHHHEICGWLSFQSFLGRPAYNATAEISIYIAKNYRKKGLGPLLLQRAIDLAPKFGIKTLLGLVFSANLPSLKLFHNYGFQNWGHLPQVADLKGIERDLVILGRRV